jgi:hypothetical protein
MVPGKSTMISPQMRTSAIDVLKNISCSVIGSLIVLIISLRTYETITGGQISIEIFCILFLFTNEVIFFIIFRPEWTIAVNIAAFVFVLSVFIVEEDASVKNHFIDFMTKFVCMCFAFCLGYAGIKDLRKRWLDSD